MINARWNTTCVLDAQPDDPHHREVKSAAEILETLKQRGVKQPEIGKLLGIAQSGVATMYTHNKNGKKRKLGYDEAIKLIEHFGLSNAGGQDMSQPPADALPSVETLAAILRTLAPFVSEALASGDGFQEIAATLREAMTFRIERPEQPIDAFEATVHGIAYTRYGRAVPPT